MQYVFIYHVFFTQWGSKILQWLLKYEFVEFGRLVAGGRKIIVDHVNTIKVKLQY